MSRFSSKTSVVLSVGLILFAAVLGAGAVQADHTEESVDNDSLFVVVDTYITNGNNYSGDVTQGRRIGTTVDWELDKHTKIKAYDEDTDILWRVEQPPNSNTPAVLHKSHLGHNELSATDLNKTTVPVGEKLTSIEASGDKVYYGLENWRDYTSSLWVYQNGSHQKLYDSNKTVISFTVDDSSGAVYSVTSEYGGTELRRNDTIIARNIPNPQKWSDDGLYYSGSQVVDYTTGDVLYNTSNTSQHVAFESSSSFYIITYDYGYDLTHVERVDGNWTETVIADLEYGIEGFSRVKYSDQHDRLIIQSHDDRGSTLRLIDPNTGEQVENFSSGSLEKSAHILTDRSYQSVGNISVVSATDPEGDSVDNISYSISRADTGEEIYNATLNSPYPNRAGNFTTGEGNYTVTATASGYPSVSDTISVDNDTTRISFQFTNDSDGGVNSGVVGGDNSSTLLELLGGLVGAILGFVALPFSLTLLFLFLFWIRRRRDDDANFAVALLAMLVLTAGVAPYTIGQASAQTETVEYEPADLLVFTASENKTGAAPISHDVVALDAQSGDEAWRTSLVDDDDEFNRALAVSWDKSTNQIYAIGEDSADDEYRIYELDDATGNITDSHTLNISAETISYRTVAQNGSLIFSTRTATYRYDASTNSVSLVYEYDAEPYAHFAAVDDGELQSFVWSQSQSTAYIYQNGSLDRSFATESNITSASHVGDGWIYQNQDDVKYVADNGTTRKTSMRATEQHLHAASDSAGYYQFMRVDNSFGYYNSDGYSVLKDDLVENGDTMLMQLDYRTVNDSETVHEYSATAVSGFDEFESTDRTHYYRIYDKTGDILYSEYIPYDSNKPQSIAIVYSADTDSTQIDTGVVGGDDGGLLSQVSPEVGLAIVMAVLVGTVIGLGIVYALLRSFWNILIYPLMILLLPLRLIWRLLDRIF